MIRWLDFNDTWLAAEWGILPTTSAAFWQRQTGFRATGRQRQSAVDHETGADRNDQSHEIQGCIALENSFNRVGLDPFC